MTLQHLPPGPFDGGPAFHERVRTVAVWLAACLLALLLAACGGGSDGPVAPAITAQPANVSVKAGASASFSVSVTGTDPFTYQWRRNGSDIAGANASSYQVDAVTAADTGAQFSVVVSNEAASVTSAAATLSVDSTVAPSLTVAPVAQTVTAGNTATFSVTATGSDPLTYQWKRNGVDIAGATSASYTTPVTAAADDGATYAVLVTNAAGSASSDAVRLSVTAAPVPASITTQPAAQTVTAGQTATFTVAADGTAPLTYQWKRNGTDIAGATAASYTTAATTVAADNGALFSVVVNNAANAPVTSAAVALTVGTADVAVSITTQPSGVSVTAGQAANFTVVAAGTAPKYQWQRDGVAIAGATSPTYTVANTAVSDSGARFTVVVSNGVNSVTSAAVTLTVGAVIIPPSVPAAQPGDASVTAPATATFTVAPAGTAPFSYQWRKNGTAISGATAASYTTPATSVAADNGALFSVVVTNSVGSATSRDATLTVAAAPTAPSITTQPADATVTVGQTASFSVVAAGTGPLTYQWQKNGAAITGATAASFTTPAVTSTDNGALYTLVVSNGQGAITSRAAVLSVAAAPSLLNGRAWAAGQLAIATSLPATNTSISAVRTGLATAIDAQGGVTVLFIKQVGSAVALHAVRGAPGSAGGSPVFGTSVLIDSGAPVNWSDGVTLAVSPGGNAIAGWVSRLPCSATTYSTSGTCQYYYTARYLVATGAWEAPTLVNDMRIPAFTPAINDAGDVAALISVTDASSPLPLLAVAWRANGQANYTKRAWPVDVANGTFLPQAVTLDSAGRILAAGTLTQPGSSNTDIGVYRGTVQSGLGASEVVDLRGAAPTFLALRSNAAGQSVLMWSQDNGTRATVYAGTLDAANATWTVTDTGQTPPAAGSAISAAVTADGDFIWYAFGRCSAQRRTAGTWFSPAALPAALCQPTGVPGTPSLASNGNFITLHPTDGSWLAYDARLNQVFNPFPHAASGSGYLLGFSKSMSVLPGTLLLSNNGVGAYVSVNDYSVLPTAAAPNGDSLSVVNGWVWYFK